MGDRAIILFTRIPAPGKTKTRLQPHLSGEECCHLHRAFLQDILDVLRRCKTGYDLIVCYAPEGDVAALKALVGEPCPSFPQRGKNLGERMHNALGDLFGMGYRHGLLIGSDVPLLTSAAIDSAFDALERKDLVLGPTEDGGYCLIGMNAPCEAVFRLTYGGSDVARATIRAAEAAGLSWAVAPCTLDIDDHNDLLKLVHILDADPSLCPATRSALASMLPKGGGPCTG